MSKSFYVRLQLVIGKQTEIDPDNAKGIFSPSFLNRYTYKVHITPKHGTHISNGIKTFTGKFENFRSAEHTFNTNGATLDTLSEVNGKFNVLWEILFDGKKHYSLAGELFAYSHLSHAAIPKWTQYSINFTTSGTSCNIKDTNVVTQTISSGVAWYLVKQEETFGALMNRAFKKPSQIDWDVMKDVNAHLDNPTSLTILKPGQVVIFSKTKGSQNTKLQKMKSDAKEAQAAWVKANADGKIDQAEMQLLDLIMQGHKVIPIAPHEISGLSQAKAVSLVDSGKPWIDGMIGFAGANFEQSSKAHASIREVAQNIPYTTEKGTYKRVVKEVGSTHTKSYRLFNDSSFARKLIQWDTGIKAGKARDYIHFEVQARSTQLNGGISSVTQNLNNVGKYTRYLKRAGYVGIAIDAGMTTVKAHDAYSHGDIKGGNIEVGKGVGSIGGGLAGGAILGYLVFGIATGGVGLVVVGVAAAVGGYYAGKAGEWAGQEAAEMHNDGLRNYYENQTKPSFEEAKTWMKK